MPIITCLGCNHETNTATCNWVTQPDHKPTKCYVRYRGDNTVPGCGLFELDQNSLEFKFAISALSQKGYPIEQHLKNWPFVEYRKDGWPLCPQCGEDELYSHLLEFSYPYDYKRLTAMTLEVEMITIQQYIDAGMRCYLCGWHLDKKG